MILISPTEKHFITAGIFDDLRADGRNKIQWRPFKISTNCLPQASGSSRVCVENGSDILVGIRLDLGVPDISAPEIGKVSCSVDW